MEDLSRFLTLLLESNGALVERSDGGRIEALLPKEIAESLGTQEYQGFSFDPRDASPQDLVITYDSEFIEKLGEMVERRGKFSRVVLPIPHIKREKAEESIKEHLILNNAIYRLKGLEEGNVPYTIFNFKYSAISDEKREDIVAVIINEATLTWPEEMLPLIELCIGKEEEGEDRGSPIMPSRRVEEVYGAAVKALKGRIREELLDFERSMNRRLNRDISRLEEYYATIREELTQKIIKRSLEGKAKEEEESKIEATELELERRINDQVEKYSIKIEFRLLSLLRIIIPSVILEVEIQRKMAKREVKVCFNPLLKKVEGLVCERCLAKGSYLCDQLHILCSQCFFKCPGCARTICRLCYPEICPRCSMTFENPLLRRVKV